MGGSVIFYTYGSTLELNGQQLTAGMLTADLLNLSPDFRAVAAAGLRQSPHAPVQGDAARRALRLADAAIQRLGAQVNPKIVLSVFAAKFRAL